MAEQVQALLGRFVLGHGELDAAITRASQCRDILQARLVELHKQGVNLFDQSYKLIPGTDPKQYTTGYTERFAQICQEECDKLTKGTRGGKVTFIVDSKGYCPVNNSWVSQNLPAIVKSICRCAATNVCSPTRLVCAPQATSSVFCCRLTCAIPARS